MKRLEEHRCSSTEGYGEYYGLNMSVMTKFYRKWNQKLLLFLGHLMRKKDLENFALTGNIEGNKDEGK